MATDTIPTTITLEAAALAKEYGVERELDAILDKGREMVAGLRAMEVEVEPWAEEDDVCVVVRGVIDPAYRDDPSFGAWYRWPVDHLPHPVWDRIRITSMLDETPHGR